MDKDMMSEGTSEKKEMGSSQKKKMSNAQVFLFGVLGAIVVIGIAGYGYTVRAVYNLSRQSVVLSVADIFNMPAVVVNGMSVPYTDYLRDVDALTTFYTQQNIPIDAEQISDQVLVRLTANRILSDVARQFDVTLTEEDIEPQKAQVLAEFSSEEEAKQQIQQLYGWSFDQFVDNIIRPLALEQKLETAFMDDSRQIDNEYMTEEVKASHILFQPEENESDDSVKARATQVLERLKKGEDFAVLAAQFGTDGTKDVGGDLGYFAKGVMVPEFEQAVFALEPGTLSEELVKTQFGYHIVRVDDKRMGRDFGTFVNDQLSKATIELKLNVHDPFVDPSVQQ